MMTTRPAPAFHANRTLRGQTPAELPVEQPTIPPSVLARADEVVE